MKLQAILDAVTSLESKLIPVFIHNPQSQSIAGVAFVAEQVFFNVLKSMHGEQPAAPVTPAQ